MDAVAQYHDSAKVLSAKELTSLERLRSLFPHYAGDQFLVIPVDRDTDFATEDVTRLNSLMMLRRHGDDEWRAQAVGTSTGSTSGL
ncbi:MAG: hypothetical protein LBL86_00905 [Coriobacteriales bacterium]|jgi:hypothetical protein|nr:hypothetical protein [Coriobacteriales bacterium]